MPNNNNENASSMGIIRYKGGIGSQWPDEER